MVKQTSTRQNRRHPGGIGGRLTAAFKRRPTIVLGLMMAVLFLCALQLVNIQIIQGPSLAAQAQKARTSSYTIGAKRGDILDAQGSVLATSVERYNIGVNQRLVKDYIHFRYLDENGKEVTDPTRFSARGVRREVAGTGAVEAAHLIAPILQVDPVVLGGKMLGDSPFSYIAKDVSPLVWRQLRALKIPGIEPELISAREYPNGNTAASVVGFVNKEGAGQAGLELTQQSQLLGKPGSGSVEISPTGKVIPDGKVTYNAPVPGANVRTTIDADLNHFAQQKLDDAVTRAGAQWGTIVGIEVKTGKILILADSGQKEPNEQKNPGEFLGSRAVQYAFEPGSTGKIITFACAMSQRKINPLSVFTVPDRITMSNGQEFSDVENHETFRLTAAGILAKSSNVGTVQVGQTVTDKYREEIMRRFGLGKKTGVELPGETAGSLIPADKWDGRGRYATMFGQGYSTNSIQVASIAATIGNGGVYMPPHLVDGWVSAAGTFTPKKAAAPHQVIEADYAKEVLAMMEGVMAPGQTGPAGQVPGYRTGGKTGTAQVYEGGVQVGVTASFTGVAPIEDPQLAMAVVLFRPTNGIYGSVLAAPVFSQVMERSLQKMKIPPSTIPAKIYPFREDQLH